MASDGKVVISTELDTPGIVDAALVMNDADMDRLASFPFEIHVDADPSAGTTQSDDYFNCGTDSKNAVLYIPQDLTPEEQAQAIANLGLKDHCSFAYNFTTVCEAPEPLPGGADYDSYFNPQDAQAIDYIVQNWGKKPMSIYVQGCPVIGVDINNHHLKVLFNDRYIYTFNWWVDGQLRYISLWAHAVVEIAYKDEILEYDHIVEQGRSNGWDYRKWANGDAECWRTVTSTVKSTAWKDSGLMSFLDYGLFWTSGMMNGSDIQFDYPLRFAGRPVETAAISTKLRIDGKYYPMFLMAVTNGQVDQTDAYRICTYKKPEEDIDMMISFRVVGKWK